MKVFLVFAAAGPMLVLTTSDALTKPGTFDRVKSLGKFISYELPIEPVKRNYSAHYEHVLRDPKQDDAYRVLDTDAKQIFTNVDLRTMGQPVIYQPE